MFGFRKKNVSDGGSASINTFLRATSELLALQLMGSASERFETNSGVNREALGYIFGFVQGALIFFRVNVNVDDAFEIVLDDLFPGQGKRYSDFFFLNYDATDTQAGCQTGKDDYTRWAEMKAAGKRTFGVPAKLALILLRDAAK